METLHQPKFIEICKEHQKENVYFCETCQKPTCYICDMKEHRKHNHDVKLLEEKRESEIKALLEQVKSTRVNSEEQKEKLLALKKEVTAQNTTCVKKLQKDRDEVVALIHDKFEREIRLVSETMSCTNGMIDSKVHTIDKNVHILTSLADTSNQTLKEIKTRLSLTKEMEKAQLQNVRLSVCFHEKYKENIVKEARILLEKVCVLSSVHRIINGQASAEGVSNCNLNPTLAQHRTGGNQRSQQGISVVVMPSLD